MCETRELGNVLSLKELQTVILNLATKNKDPRSDLFDEIIKP